LQLETIGLPSSPDTDCAPGEAVRAQLKKIFASTGFSKSERSSKLLRYLVLETLAGRGADIREYVLGAELFARGASFDPYTDAIVRTEMSRLRGKLKAYYGVEGRHDRLTIELPLRSYEPLFNVRKAPEPQSASAPRAYRRMWLWMCPTLIVIAGLLLYQVSRASANVTHSRRADAGVSVAVLPFVNSEADQEVEQFADGLTEEIIETLQGVEGLRVVSQTSAFQFKGRRDDLRTIAQKLNAGVVLEGTARRAGKQLHITARLVNAADGHQYYSQTYEDDFKDAPGLQREIAAKVANVLRVHQVGEEVGRFTKSPEAHRWYLHGLHHASHVSESEIREAIGCFQAAISYDPDYSPAYASLSDAYVTLALLNEGPPDTMRRASEAARTAVRTGPTLAHAHAALGSVLALYEWQWPKAEAEFRKAIEEAPNDSEILRQYAMRYLVPQIDLDSALFELQLAQRVDPLSPMVLLDRGKIEHFQRRPAKAINTIRLAQELDPELEVAPLALAEAYVQNSSFDEASKTLRESSAPTEDEARLAVLGSVYGLSRQPERARKTLTQLTELDRHYRHISGYYFSQVYLALGDRPAALGSLEKAAEERSPMIVYAKVAPQFDSLRGEPRFRALLQRIGLEP
jgi:serine/threonine-protein kinase